MKKEIYQCNECNYETDSHENMTIHLWEKYVTTKRIIIKK